MSSVGTYAAGRYGQRVDETWPTTGIPTSPYSRNSLPHRPWLDRLRKATRRSRLCRITRMRPGIHHSAGRPASSPRRASGTTRLRPDARWCPPALLPLTDARAFRSFMPTMSPSRSSARWTAVLGGAFDLAAKPPGAPTLTSPESWARRAGSWPSAVLGALVDLSWRSHCNRSTVVCSTWLSALRLLTAHGRHASSTGIPSGLVHRCARSICSTLSRSRVTPTAPPLRRRSMLEQLYRDITKGNDHQ